MREIKFRAWQKQPSLHRPIGMYKVNDIVWYDEPFDGNTGEVFFFGAPAYTSSEYIEDLELMQYTGLKDKNGVEIYEGDIVEATFNDGTSVIGEVEWSKANAAFGIPSADDPDMLHHLNGITSIRVLGNIYENKELLR